MKEMQPSSVHLDCLFNQLPAFGPAIDHLHLHKTFISTSQQLLNVFLTSFPSLKCCFYLATNTF